MPSQLSIGVALKERLFSPLASIFGEDGGFSLVVNVARNNGATVRGHVDQAEKFAVVTLSSSDYEELWSKIWAHGNGRIILTRDGDTITGLKFRQSPHIHGGLQHDIE
jgi:hypothetical protein